MKAASTQEGSGEGTAAPVRPARGRKMNSNPAPRTPIVDVPPKVIPRTQAGKGKAKVEDDTKSVASSTSGWGKVSRGPWGGGSVSAPSVKDDRADEDEGDDNKSVAASSVDGWGRVSRGPWGGSSVGGAPSVKDDWENKDAEDDARTVNGSEVGSGRKGKGKSWADQMDDEDGRSVASGTSGWGNVSIGPWGEH